MTHALSGDVGERSHTETVPECATEMARPEAHDGGEVGRAQARVNIRLDVVGHAFSQPSGEAALQGGRPVPAVFVSVSPGMQHRWRGLRASLRRIALAVRSPISRIARNSVCTPG